ncbi:MAG: hypothetical protein ABIH77_03590 [Pseudomonadota bacterium]|nr:hypothetical protein [Gammaproteobacteria bacterium]MBU1558495.1 hypothetical protein [Gammaproteobacteria bacterium]MBU1629049.1 hypothetical protein [Gammaproteobacteria bacterium]MBU1927330.1 hypothetical protein [Gammaproteobacteria bacterium]MBU2546438.1 hypothetical protein [Gammaproteobacteria bacterium]
MKRFITLMLSITFFFFSHLAFAVLAQPRVILVQNNTDETINVQSSISSTLSFKIKINGTTDTPNLKIGPNAQDHFLIENNGYSGGLITGNIYFELGRTPIYKQQKEAVFPIIVGGNQQDIQLGYNPYAYSNSDVAIAAIQLNLQDGIIEISPAPNSKLANQ